MSRRSHSRARSKLKKRRAELNARRRRALVEPRRTRKHRRPYIERPLPQEWPW